MNPLLFSYYIGNTPSIDRLKIPSLKLQDAGNGFRTSDARMVGQVTSWTCALGLATAWDPELVREWASAVADEYIAKGANVILGPGLNVHRVARGGRNAEYMSGEDPFLGASFAEPFVSGFQDKGVLTTVSCVHTTPPLPNLYASLASQPPKPPHDDLPSL